VGSRYGRLKASSWAHAILFDPLKNVDARDKPAHDEQTGRSAGEKSARKRARY